MKQLVKQPNDIELIREYYERIRENLHDALKNAMKIGEILIHIQEKLQYGEFGPWVKENISFISYETARRYMKIYQYKDVIEERKITELSKAYLVFLPSYGLYVERCEIRDTYKKYRKNEKLKTKEKQLLKIFLEKKLKRLKVQEKKTVKEIKSLI